MADDDTADHDQVVLRVSQLDASELDNELLQILKNQFTSAFQYFKPGVLATIEPELNAALRLLVWRFSVYASSATLGQQILNIKYKDKVNKKPQMSLTQKSLYGLIFVGGKWFQERSTDLSSFTRHKQIFTLICGLVDYAEKLLKVVTVVNFLLFLQDGRYQHVTERVLGIKARFAKRQSIRQVSFEYMTRELLWHGFAEFLFFILPLINFQKIKNFISRRFAKSSSSGGDDTMRSAANYEECVVCGEWPTLPHHIGCQHVFCYYCIQSNYLADASYTCPLCGKGIDNDIQSVKCQLSL
uniref:Peroxisome biogenesis factor 2 n=1 Tax=Saccoglossus kowalevskii TaxID=10224 RepID=A0ABM0MSI7_SACKO|nr:PREDICTED: peroxisome biogenesis factor 2-like [Saccoglossus kowalevskii]